MATRNPILASIPPAPPDRGRLWYDFEIPKQFLNDLPGIGNKAGWVRRNFPADTRIKIGKASAWYESDVVAAIAGRRGKNPRKKAA